LFCWQPYARTDWHVTWLQPNDLIGLAEQTLRGTVDTVAVQRQITRAEALADVIGEDAARADVLLGMVVTRSNPTSVAASL
jgi:hypothetical protein